ncbi:MAG: M56 family metallopeptidase [Lachnospiraceae bacterium]|nr:M56 family metallopeptidase [Lachnospiraceae bacterium]
MNWSEVMDVNLLQMSFTGGIMIVAIVVLRAILIHRMPKKTFLILWGIVLCRLLFPYELESAVSVYTLMPKGYPVMDETGQMQMSEFLPAEQQTVEVNSTGVDQPVKAAGSFPVWTVIWMIGAVLCFSYYMVSYIRGYRKYRQSLPLENELLKEWYMTHGLKRKLLVRQSDQITAPLTYGFLHPVILMPKTSDWENRRQIGYILEHEYVHIQRFDTAAKLVMVFAACIHWFNPLVWIMYILFNRDIELSCDETVIRRFGENTRAAYAKLLISMEEKKTSLAPFGSSFSKTAIEERIMAIMKIRKPSFAMIVTASAMIVSITAVFATSASSDTDAPEQIPDTEFSDGEYQKLLALKYDGYERMSVSEYQERVWKDTDTRAYNELLERFSQDDTIYNLRDVNDISGFLNNTLLPLTGEKWQAHEFSGCAVTDYPYPCDQASLEYTFTLTILDADKLTVGEYMDACDGMRRGLSNILEGRSAEELQDETEIMTRYILQQENILEKQYAAEGLKITVDGWSYTPLVNIPEEDAVAAEEWEYRESHYGTDEDYRSLLSLKTEDYQNMRLSDFNAGLLEWANADYDRMERINTDMAWEDRKVNLSEEEQLFVALTVYASGMENAKAVQSEYTGEPEEDPVFGEYTLDKSEEAGRGSAWCNMYYRFSYHIPDKSRIKVGERDRCISGMLSSIQTFWEKTSLDELLKMEKSDILAMLQSFAEDYSNDLISVSIDALQVEKMDERKIE